MVRKGVIVAMLFVIVLALVDYSRAINYYYCKLRSCHGLPHTVCMFPSGVSTICSRRIINSGLTKEEKKKIVDLHNQLRQKVASGQETRGNPGPQPSAKFMPKAEWDDELASVAQRWADQCNFGHDQCRDVKRFKVGQNIAYLGTTGDVNDLKVEDMVQMWYDEVQHFSKHNVSQFRTLRASNGEQIGHYTQLVWAKSTKIGCGAVKYRDGNFNRFFLVCNYGPAGNYIGEPIYESH